uniref:C-type lectin domain-containing protein n=1 Tax=Paramormyrops kingsleyae TaxID=1676925 RepID=A0A3B3RNN8_9TELE
YIGSHSFCLLVVFLLSDSYQALADGNSYRCPKPWLTYRDQCFDLRRLKKVWKEALAECRRDGGDLASIHDIAEQDFIISQLGYLECKWRLGGVILSMWSDGSAVTFTKWELGEPSHFSVLKEDCVLMRGEVGSPVREGKWADDNCENDFGYMLLMYVL